MNENARTSSPQAVASDVLTDELYVRIVRADLEKRVRKSISTNNALRQYVTHQNGQLYFALDAIENPQQRQQVRRQLQLIQLGETRNIGQLPTPLQQLFEPEWTPIGRFVAAATIGLAVGIASGTLAMATSLLLTAVTELIIGHTMNTDLIGMQVTAVAFVIFSVLGAALTITRIWHRIPASLLTFFQQPGAGASFQSQQSLPTPPRPESNETPAHTE